MYLQQQYKHWPVRLHDDSSLTTVSEDSPLAFSTVQLYVPTMLLRLSDNRDSLMRLCRSAAPSNKYHYLADLCVEYWLASFFVFFPPSPRPLQPSLGYDESCCGRYLPAWSQGEHCLLYQHWEKVSADLRFSVNWEVHRQRICLCRPPFNPYTKSTC